MHKFQIQKKDWNQLIKLTVVMIVVLYLWHTYYIIHATQQIVEASNQLFSDQKEQTTSLHQKARREIKSVKEGLADGDRELNEKTAQLGEKIHQFKNEFISDLEKIFREDSEDLYREKSYQFLNGHRTVYDRELYEMDAAKVTKRSKVVLPNFDSFMRLRERMYYCLMLKNNKYLTDRYRNAIAKLKSEGKERQIAMIKKPVLLSWPLTEEKLIAYNEENILRGQVKFYSLDGFGTYVELDGRCT